MHRVATKAEFWPKAAQPILCNYGERFPLWRRISDVPNYILNPDSISYMHLPVGQGHRDSKLIIDICGIRSKYHLRTAIQAGANAIGLMQVPSSSRYVSIEETAMLRQLINYKRNGVKAVVVVANHSEADMHEIINTVKPDMIQFHGSESKEYCLSFALPYIKAIQSTGTNSIREAVTKYPSASYLLLDTPTKLLGD